ncbi:MAG: cation:proton antiporter [Hadesarchaea archaeon]|nr:cation:proton antiporter [Hadesarchaea archaeon]
MTGMSLIVRTASRLLLPFMVLFGAYVVLHGHLTPGGGFQGGVIIAASLLMLVLAYGIHRLQAAIDILKLELVEALGGLILVGTGLAGLAAGVAKFYGHVLPLGRLGELFSGGNLPLLNVGTGIKVAAGIALIFYAMLRVARGEEA